MGLEVDTLDRIVQMARSSGATVINTPNGLPFTVVPNDCAVKSLADLVYSDYAEKPHRIKQTVSVLDAGSFCEYYTKFFDANSRVFADETRGLVLAILDYHAAGDGNSPRWGSHRVSLTFRESEEWKRWNGKNGVKFTQMDFAEFIENNAPDVVTPAAATMLEVARDLTATTDGDFASAVTLSNGSIQLKYSEQVKATFGSGQIEIPASFSISIPVYLGEDRINLTARLRYRIQAGKLTFWYDLLRADVAKRDAFLKSRTIIADTLKIDIINGTPA